VRLSRVASCVVAVLVALAKPRIVVSREAGRRQRARLHARLETQELAVQLRSARNVETLVDGNYFH